MRIAFVEWYPRICGTGDGTVHLSAAAEKLGHTMERVTFSKSGRQLKAFGEKGDDWSTVKMAEGAEYLDQFDLVIPSDVVCQHPNVDGRAIKDETMPYYVGMLGKTKTPFALLIWGGYYHTKHDPFIQALLALPNFTGAAWTPRPPDAPARFDHLAPEGRPIRWVPIPYHPYDAYLDERVLGIKKTRELMMTSRVTSNKGQDVALEIFGDVDATFNIWGTSAYGKPSPAWRLWELGMALGYREVSFPVIANRTNNKHPEAHKFITGHFELGHPTSDARWIFHEEYERLDDLDWSPWVGLSLTNDGLHGSLEYACLDVIARGSVLVCPDHMYEFCEYDSIQGFPFRHASFSEKDGKVKAGRNDWDRDATVELIRHHVHDLSDQALADLRERQYAELREKHDPRRVLEPLLQEAGR